MVETPMAGPKDAESRLQAYAAQLGLELSITRMVQSTRTAEDAAAACGCCVAQIVKSLVFQGADSKSPLLLLVSGPNRVNERAATQYAGEKLKRPNADYVRTITGFAIGGIPPFGHTTRLATYFDRDLLQYDQVWAAAGTPNSVFAIAPDRLAALTSATIVDV